jgi:hypothetical protein
MLAQTHFWGGFVQFERYRSESSTTSNQPKLQVERPVWSSRRCESALLMSQMLDSILQRGGNCGRGSAGAAARERDVRAGLFSGCRVGFSAALGS